MEPARAAQALAEASSSMTASHDIAGGLTALLDNCQDGLGVDAGAILLQSGGHLDLMAASSHQATELELYQLHADEGPCLDAYLGGVAVDACSAEELIRRWPGFGRAALAAGFASVHATPLRMQGATFGALGLFRREEIAFTRDEGVVAAAFADIASMLVAHYGEVSPEQLMHRVQEALGARIVIEQAKGVLADVHSLSMAEAYDLLIQSAHDRDVSLTARAEDVVRAAQTRG